MAWNYQRLDRLRQIVAEAVKRNTTPNDINFASFVKMMTAALGITPKTGREYIETLTSAYKFNKWKSYLTHNDYIEKEAAETWLNANMKKI